MVDPGGLTLHDITVHAVDLEPALLGDLSVGARTSDGHLTGLTVTDSTFIGGSAANCAAPVVLAAANTLAGMVSDSTLDDVVFSHNEVEGGLEGFYVYGLEGNGATGADDTVRHVLISNNYFHDSTDAAMNLDGATGIVDNLGTSGISDVTMTGNRILANNWAIGIWGGEAFGGASVNGAFIRDVTISHNQLSGVATGNVIDGVNVVDTDARTCGDAGVTVHGGVSLAGGVVSGNVARNVLITNNAVADTPIGLVLRGGDASGPGSTLTGNTVEAVQVSQHRALSRLRGEPVPSAQPKQWSSTLACAVIAQ